MSDVKYVDIEKDAWLDEYKAPFLEDIELVCPSINFLWDELFPLFYV